MYVFLKKKFVLFLVVHLFFASCCAINVRPGLNPSDQAEKPTLIENTTKNPNEQKPNHDANSNQVSVSIMPYVFIFYNQLLIFVNFLWGKVVAFYTLINDVSLPHVNHNDSYSFFINYSFLPVIKCVIFLSIIFFSIFLLYASMSKLVNLLCSLSGGKHEVKKPSDNYSIVLKGRVRKQPENINYRELFINNSQPKTKHNHPSHPQKQKSSLKDLDDYFDRVKEKNDFNEFFEKSKYEVVEVHQPKAIKEENDLLLWDDKRSEDGLLKAEDLYHETEAQKEKSDEYQPDDMLVIEEKEEGHSDDSDSLFKRIKNPNLYHQTPLANIRIDTSHSRK